MRTCPSSPGWALRAADAILASLGLALGDILGFRLDEAGRERARRVLARIMVRERLRGMKVVLPLFSASGAHVCVDCGLRYDEHPAVCEPEPALVALCDGRLAQL